MEELWTPDAREKGRLEKPKNWKMEERNNWKMEEFCDIYIYLLEIRVSWAAGKSDRLTDYLTDDLSTLSSRYICHNSSIFPSHVWFKKIFHFSSLSGIHLSKIKICSLLQLIYDVYYPMPWVEFKCWKIYAPGTVAEGDTGMNFSWCTFYPGIPGWNF